MGAPDPRAGQPEAVGTERGPAQPDVPVGGGARSRGTPEQLAASQVVRMFQAQRDFFVTANTVLLRSMPTGSSAPRRVSARTIVVSLGVTEARKQARVATYLKTWAKREKALLAAREAVAPEQSASVRPDEPGPDGAQRPRRHREELLKALPHMSQEIRILG